MKPRFRLLAPILVVAALASFALIGTAQCGKTVDPAPVPSAPGGSTDGSANAAGDAAARTAAEHEIAVLKITSEFDEIFAGSSGEDALSALRRLADIVPEGRKPAMALAIRINDDVRGEGALGIDTFHFYQSLSDTAIRDLLVWSLKHESPPQFRQVAAASLPWVLTREEAVLVLTTALATESDPAVTVAIVGNVSNMKDPRAEAALTAILADHARDGFLRAVIAGTLSATKSDDVVRQLEGAAKDDPDERVRAAAHAALVARNPEVDGYLITLVTPGAAAAAAGVVAGDIVINYDAAPIRATEDLAAASAAAAGRDGVAITVHRVGSGDVALVIRGGALGVQGRAVRTK